MAFRKFMTAGVRKTSNVRRKGRDDGLMTGKNFDKFVRRPFRDKTFQQAAGNSQNRRGYDAFDHQQFENTRRRAVRTTNYSQLPAAQARQELRQMKALPRSPRRSTNRQIGW